ncbi:MAG: endonuclease, partial [Tepidisphaeraceae bacterium]
MHLLRMRCSIRCISGAILLSCFVCFESPARAQYDPPADYYSSINTGNLATLRTQIRTVIARNYYNQAQPHRVVTYADARFGLAVTDLDPNNSNNIILVYTGASVDKTWDAINLPWNREHTWPDSLGLNGSGPDFSDLHQLRSCNTQVNSDRGNLPFGIGAGLWDPDHGAPDRGNMARQMFYMDVRYDGSEADTTNLVLVNGNNPGANQMGDLAWLLKFHYQDPVDTNERRRNHTVFSNSTNPTYYQGNRNAFIDHPEWVWSIFGGGNNSSTLYFGGSVPGDGASTVNVNLGRIMRNGSLGTQNVTLNKAGANPTTYDITASGSATSTATGTQQSFDYNAQSRSMTIGLNASTATTGTKSGVVTIDNTDITSGGAGMGLQDLNDTINVSAAVVDNRVIAASVADFGRILVGHTYTAYSRLTTTGVDDSFTRVTADNAAVGSGGSISLDAAAGAKLFDDPTDLMIRGVTVNFPILGNYSGAIGVAVTGEGLAGESVQPLSIPYQFQVVSGDKDPSDNTGGEGGGGTGGDAGGPSVTIDFGEIDLSDGLQTRPFDMPVGSSVNLNAVLGEGDT